MVERGNVIGTMGNSGQSTGPHLHIDVAKGRVSRVYRLTDLAGGFPEPDFKQLTYFIDEELTGGPFRVTTWPYDYRYVIRGAWKPHPGYDIVAEGDPPLLYWNRSMRGSVIGKGFDNGYGHYVQIAFRA